MVFRLHNALQHRRLPAAPDGVGLAAAIGKSAGNFLVRALITEQARIGDGRVHRDARGIAPTVSRSFIARRDGINGDVVDRLGR